LVLAFCGSKTKAVPASTAEEIKIRRVTVFMGKV